MSHSSSSGIALQNARAVLFEAQKQLNVPDNSALQRFVKSGAKLAVGKRLQHRRIDQHDPGMVESSHQILPGDQIHSRLAANGGIDLRQHRRRNLHQLDPAHIKRGQQPAHIAYDAAAKSDDHRLAIRAQARQFFSHCLDGSQALRRLAVGHRQNLRRKSAGLERSNQLRSPALAHWWNCHHKNAAGLRQQFA